MLFMYTVDVFIILCVPESSHLMFVLYLYFSLCSLVVLYFQK